MADEKTDTADKDANLPKEVKKPEGEAMRVFLVPYPKVVFLYPTFIMSLVCGIWMSFTMETKRGHATLLAG